MPISLRAPPHPEWSGWSCASAGAGCCLYLCFYGAIKIAPPTPLPLISLCAALFFFFFQMLFRSFLRDIHGRTSTQHERYLQCWEATVTFLLHYQTWPQVLFFLLLLTFLIVSDERTHFPSEGRLRTDEILITANKKISYARSSLKGGKLYTVNNGGGRKNCVKKKTRAVEEAMHCWIASCSWLCSSHMQRKDGLYLVDKNNSIWALDLSTRR